MQNQLYIGKWLMYVRNINTIDTYTNNIQNTINALQKKKFSNSKHFYEDGVLV